MQNPINISGVSVSTDGGATFTRVTNASGQSPFSSTEGDPVVLYNRPTPPGSPSGLIRPAAVRASVATSPPIPRTRLAGPISAFIAARRTTGILAGRTTTHPLPSPTGCTFPGTTLMSAAGLCSSPTPVITGLPGMRRYSVTTTFIRDVQITGDKVTGDVYIAGMDEMGGGLANRANKIYRSTDGGNTWTNTYTGPTFPGPGRTASGFFATHVRQPRLLAAQGWGEPAAFNDVVSYVYAARNTGNGDPGDVFYIRSTDSGVTFSAPFQLNANTEPTKAQWMPNLSVSESGTLFATWYDETPRTSASCQPSSPTNLCYQMHSRKSPDNGVTWRLTKRPRM